MGLVGGTVYSGTILRIVPPTYIQGERPDSADKKIERERVREMRSRLEIFQRSSFRSRSVSAGLRIKLIPEVTPKFGFDGSEDTSLEETNSSESISDSHELPDISPADESWSDRSTKTEEPPSDDILDDGPESSADDNSNVYLDIQTQGSDDTDSNIKLTLTANPDIEEARDFGSGSIVSMSRIINSSSESEDSGVGSYLSEDEILQAEPAEIDPELRCPIGIGELKTRIHCDG